MASEGNTLGKVSRLSGKKSIATLLADGKWGSYGHFRYCWLAAAPSQEGCCSTPPAQEPAVAGVSAVHSATATHGLTQKTSVNGTTAAICHATDLSRQILIQTTSQHHVHQLLATADAKDRQSAPEGFGGQKEIGSVPRAVHLDRGIQHLLAITGRGDILAAGQHQRIHMRQHLRSFRGRKHRRQHHRHSAGSTHRGQVGIAQRHPALVPAAGNPHYRARLPASGQHCTQQHRQQNDSFHHFSVAEPTRSAKLFSMLSPNSFSPPNLSESARK